MIQQTINIAGIMEDSIVDGPGLRTAIFAQGCPRRCEGCHNPESWAFGTGTDMTVQDLFWRVKKNPLVRGVTFSGGEPFSQAEPFTELAKLLKANGYEVASYTGYTFEELLENGTPAQKQLLAALDILVDGEFVLAQQRKPAHPGRTPEPCPRQSRMVYGGALGGRTAVITRALRPRGTTETLAAPISCGRGSACRKRAILCAKCAKLPFCAPERSAEGNRKASAQHKASGVSQRLTALPAASAALRVKILFAIIGTFITRPVKE